MRSLLLCEAEFLALLIGTQEAFTMRWFFLRCRRSLCVRLNGLGEEHWALEDYILAR